MSARNVCREAIGELVYQSQSSRIEVILRDEVVGGFDAGGRYATGVAVPAIGYLGPIRQADGPFLGKATAPSTGRVLTVSGSTGFLAGGAVKQPFLLRAPQGGADAFGLMLQPRLECDPA